MGSGTLDRVCLGPRGRLVSVGVDRGPLAILWDVDWVQFSNSLSQLCLVLGAESMVPYTWKLVI